VPFQVIFVLLMVFLKFLEPNRRFILKEYSDVRDGFNTRSASAASLPESANGGQIDRRVVYCLLIFIMLSGEGKYLKIIFYRNLVIYFVMFYTYDVSNRPIPENVADSE